MVQKFRKKPSEVEAVKFTRDNFEEVQQFCEGKATDLFLERRLDGICYFILQTSEGDRTVDEGDWIIKDRPGSFYALGERTFHTLYVRV